MLVTPSGCGCSYSERLIIFCGIFPQKIIQFSKTIGASDLWMARFILDKRSSLVVIDLDFFYQVNICSSYIVQV